VRDARGMLWMGRKPGNDGAAAIGRDLAIDIGVKLMLGHG
jgi:hypothetical protein